MRDVRLYTPGPTPIHPRALAALGWPMRSHMDPEVFAFNDRVVQDLHELFKTPAGSFASLLSGTGSLGMETGFTNLLEVGERVLIVSNGVFGERMVEMARRLGASVTPVRFAAGERVSVARVRAVAHFVKPKLIAMVHGETSTGVLNPVADVGEIAREVGALYAVDAVTTVGMLAFDMASWGIDYAYTGSQKCLSAPPGVAPVAFSGRAMAVIRARKTRVASWYGDALGMQNYWLPGEGGRKYHHTVPLQLHYATGEAIRACLEEGVEARTRRVVEVGAAVLRTLASVGFTPFVPDDYRLPTVLALRLPAGLDDLATRRVLQERYALTVTGGLGKTAGQIWRLGFMGEGARQEHYRALMVALAELLAAPKLPDLYDGALAVAA